MTLFVAVFATTVYVAFAVSVYRWINGDGEEW